jgi:hypothetical protein
MDPTSPAELAPHGEAQDSSYKKDSGHDFEPPNPMEQLEWHRL